MEFVDFAVVAGQHADHGLAIAALSGEGETVVCVLPGHDSENDEFHCDREIFESCGQWRVQAIRI